MINFFEMSQDKYKLCKYGTNCRDLTNRTCQFMHDIDDY
jgi:hypothetical protein